jgi:hypothetical protein
VKARWLFGRVAKREFLGIEKLLEKPLDKRSEMCDTTAVEGTERKRW